MKKLSLIVILIISLTLGGCAGMSNTEQRTLSGGAIGTGAGAIVGAIAGHTVWGAAIGAAAGAAGGAAGGFLYDHHEKAKQAEYEKGYQAGQQSAKTSQ